MSILSDIAADTDVVSDAASSYSGVAGVLVRGDLELLDRLDCDIDCDGRLDLLENLVVQATMSSSLRT